MDFEIGDIVKIADWTGVVIDKVVTKSGKVLLQIDSPKDRYHNHRPEWLECNAELILHGNAQDIRCEVDRYRRLLETRLKEVSNFGTGYLQK